MAAEIKEAVLSGGTFPSQYSVGCFCLDLSESLTSFWTMGLLSVYLCWCYHLRILCASSTSNKLSKLQNDRRQARYKYTFYSLLLFKMEANVSRGLIWISTQKKRNKNILLLWSFACLLKYLFSKSRDST